MQGLPVTSLYAAIGAFWLVLLSLRVIWLRNVERVGIGHEQNPRMARAVRVHGNAAEYLPLALILLALAELNGVSPPWLHGCGIALLAGRFIHAFGLGRTAGRSLGRIFGMVLTFAAILTLATFNLLHALQV